MTHKKAELLAVQKKIADAKALFTRQTDKLVVEQQETLEAESALLLKEIAKEQKTLRKIKTSIKDAMERHSTLEATIVDKALLVEEIDKTLADAQSALESANDSAILATESQVAIREEIQRLEAFRSAIEAQITTLEQRSETKKTEISDLTGRHNHNKRVFAADEAKMQQNLQLSESKLIENTQLYEKQMEQAELVRSELAAWQKSLEERDQNLRVREQKVEQGENKIVRNSNLLNL